MQQWLGLIRDTHGGHDLVDNLPLQVSLNLVVGHSRLLAGRFWPTYAFPITSGRHGRSQIMHIATHLVEGMDVPEVVVHRPIANHSLSPDSMQVVVNVL